MTSFIPSEPPFALPFLSSFLMRTRWQLYTWLSLVTQKPPQRGAEIERPQIISVYMVCVCVGWWWGIVRRRMKTTQLLHNCTKLYKNEDFNLKSCSKRCFLLYPAMNQQRRTSYCRLSVWVMKIHNNRTNYIVFLDFLLFFYILCGLSPSLLSVFILLLFLSS